MNFYRAARNFIGNHFIAPFEDFCAVNYPAFYENLFTQYLSMALRIMVSSSG